DDGGCGRGGRGRGERCGGHYGDDHARYERVCAERLQRPDLGCLGAWGVWGAVDERCARRGGGEGGGGDAHAHGRRCAGERAGTSDAYGAPGERGGDERLGWEVWQR